MNAARRRAATSLAEISGTVLLGICFAGDAIAAVTEQPTLDAAVTRGMVLSYLRQRRR